MKSINCRSLALLCMGLLAVFGTACSSIVHGGNRTIAISSQPSGAKVTIRKTNSGVEVAQGTTPYTASLDPKARYFRGQEYTVSISLDGYQSAEIQIHPEMSGWYFGNIVFGGLIGMVVVDPLTGSMWNLSPDKITQTLTPKQAQLLKEKGGFCVVLVSELTADQQKNLVRIQ